MDEHTYKTIEKTAQAEFKDQGSKFIAFVFPIREVDEFKAHLRIIKKKHPKATHHCFAYRLSTEGLQFRASDAGEPSGSAGRPILAQIDRLGITDVLVVVVRYFGGTLLGIPGLMRAYKTAAAFALQMTPVVIQKIASPYRLNFDYTRFDQIMQLIRRNECTVYKQDMQLFCSMEIGLPLINEQSFLDQLLQIPGAEIARLSEK